MSDMNKSAPYAIKNALLEAGFSLQEILDLAENPGQLLKNLKDRYDARRPGQTHTARARQESSVSS